MEILQVMVVVAIAAPHGVALCPVTLQSHTPAHPRMCLSAPNLRTLTLMDQITLSRSPEALATACLTGVLALQAWARLFELLEEPHRSTGKRNLFGVMETPSLLVVQKTLVGTQGAAGDREGPRVLLAGDKLPQLETGVSIPTVSPKDGIHLALPPKSTNLILGVTGPMLQPVREAVTAWNAILAGGTTHQGMNPLLLCLPKTWTPGFCATQAGDKHLYASTPLGRRKKLHAPTTRMTLELMPGAHPQMQPMQDQHQLLAMPV